MPIRPVKSWRHKPKLIWLQLSLILYKTLVLSEMLG
jgi:hypothetical protein